MDYWISISDLARRAEMPESTTRRYIDRFEKYFKYEDRGRRKRFEPQMGVEMLNLIQELYNSGMDTENIDAFLANKYGIVLESSTTAESTQTSDKYKQTDEEISLAIRTILANMTMETSNKLSNLSESVERLNNGVATMTNLAEEAKTRDRQYIDAIIALEENQKMLLEEVKQLRSQISEEKQNETNKKEPSLFQRWFGKG